MTEETRETIKILDHIGQRQPPFDGKRHGRTLKIIWHVPRIYIALRHDHHFWSKHVFVAGINLRRLLNTDNTWSGFELLERLAVLPEFATKLAEPIND